MTRIDPSDEDGIVMCLGGVTNQHDWSKVASTRRDSPNESPIQSSRGTNAAVSRVGP